jgi:hypothetical protein
MKSLCQLSTNPDKHLASSSIKAIHDFLNVEVTNRVYSPNYAALCETMSEDRGFVTNLLNYISELDENVPF